MKNERPELEVKFHVVGSNVVRYALKYNHQRGDNYWVGTSVHTEKQIRQMANKGEITREQLEKMYVEKGYKDASYLTDGQLIDMIFE